VEPAFFLASNFESLRVGTKQSKLENKGRKRKSTSNRNLDFLQSFDDRKHSSDHQG